ncbi:MAG: hypothetical protein KBB39_08675 [Phycicoccus sp.]|nr:hypothetical protein [Phycicoccus sp.]
MSALTQPIGIFPFPAGLMLLPEGTPSEVRDTLAAGRMPQAWPQELAAHAAAHRGDPDAALACLDGQDPVSAYNRWILDPDREDLELVRTGLPSAWQPLVDIVAYMSGASDEVPTVPADAAAEVQALGASARAAAALQAGDADGALTALEDGITWATPVLPALAALFQANAGTIAHENAGADDVARTHLQAAATVLTHTDLPISLAEVHHQLGSLAHAQAAAHGEPLRQAMHHYHTALQLVTEESAPYLWATTQLNLAVAYLSSPMTGAGDQLRHGIATQSLRASLRILTAQEHPDLWGTATLNLANALVYTPSTHQGDNLVEAVELYEEVLARRSREHDPLGRARVLANQGNVLAHLGMFEPAKAKLVEARYLFEEQLDHDGVLTVRSVLDEIARATVGSDDASDAREMGQMARMPVPAASAGSGLGSALMGDAPPRPKVTILSGDDR